MTTNTQQAQNEVTQQNLNSATLMAAVLSLANVLKQRNKIVRKIDLSVANMWLDGAGSADEATSIVPDLKSWLDDVNAGIETVNAHPRHVNADFGGYNMNAETILPHVIKDSSSRVRKVVQDLAKEAAKRSSVV